MSTAQQRSKALLVASWVGFGLTFPLWLLGWISDRTMIGITLALSWLALIYEARNGVHITDEGPSA